MSDSRQRLYEAYGCQEVAVSALADLHAFAYIASEDKTISKADRALWSSISLSAGAAETRIQKAGAWLNKLASNNQTTGEEKQ